MNKKGGHPARHLVRRTHPTPSLNFEPLTLNFSMA
jgi:hypothetical protein